jgi:hypothetical protein
MRMVFREPGFLQDLWVGLCVDDEHMVFNIEIVGESFICLSGFSKSMLRNSPTQSTFE